MNGGGPVKVLVGLKIDDIARYCPPGSSDPNIVAVSGLLHVEWRFARCAWTNTSRAKLEGVWRPDIRLLNSVSVAEPLLNDNTEVLCLPGAVALAKVHVQFHTRSYTTQDEKKVIQLRLGSYTSSTRDVELTPIAEVLEIGQRAASVYGDSIQTSMTTEREQVKSYMAEDVMCDRLIATVVVW